MADMAIFQVQEPDSVMPSRASPGSSVGDTNDWILFLWFILIVFCPWFRSATSHPVQNTQNHRFFDPKHHFLTHERQKSTFIKKYAIFCPMMQGIAEWHVFIPNEAFLVAKSAHGPRGANPGKISQFFKIRVFHETYVGLGVDSPYKTAG